MPAHRCFRIPPRPTDGRAGSFPRWNVSARHSYADLPKPENGRVTRKGNKLYYHVYEEAIGDIPLYGVHRADVEKVRLLATGAEVPISDNWMTANYPDTVFVTLGENPVLPDPIDTVLEVTLKA